MANSSEQNYLESNPENQLFVVGIGASTGGLNALGELFDSLPANSDAAYVVIQHLSPDYKSLMKELLERHTQMDVYRVEEGMELQPNSVYLIPPGQNLSVTGKILHLKKRKQDRDDKYELNFPIDLFFKSLAKSYGDRAVGIILSGSGSDGSQGLEAIKAARGLTLVQEASTAQFDGMPRSAIATNAVDGVLPIREIAKIVSQYVADESLSLESNSATEHELFDNYTLKKIIAILLERENLNFSNYKTRTISRRIQRRLLIKNLDDIQEYIQLLENDAKERSLLGEDLLINVTSFFRDREAWSEIETKVLPLIIERAKPHQELRFWVAACSTGQEAYSLAILIHEALQQTDKPLTVKMFATDIDRSALDIASLGNYPLSIAEEITPVRLNRYFIKRDNHYQVTRTLRDTIIFSFQDLTKDAGFTRMNLVSCRNVLIYMQSKLQDKVIRDLHFALAHQGVLFLGQAETIGHFESEFHALDKKRKVFQKRRNIRLPSPIDHNLMANYAPAVRRKSQPQKYIKESIKEQTLKRILQVDKAIALAVNRDRQLLYVSGDAQHILQTPNGEITHDITKMVIVSLQLPLNTALRRSKKEKQPIAYKGIKLNLDEPFQQVKLQVFPPVTNSQDDFYIIKIEPETVAIKESGSNIEEFKTNSQAQQRINELELELQYTRENLQAIVEELESSNEEQQASNEELIASNEELQSTNEELHSVNEEIHTVNAEYQYKIQQLTELGNDIDNLLESTKIGVIFLDRQLRIRKFTPAASEVIALRHTDVERPIEELHLKIECPDFLNLLHQVLKTKQSLELEVQLQQKDDYFLMGINPYQTDKQDRENEGLVLTFVKINETKKAQFALKERERSFQAIFNSMFQFIGVLTPEGITIEANQTALEFGGLSLEDVLGKPFWEAKWWTISPETQEQLKQAIASAARGEFVRYEVDVLGSQNRIATIDFSLKPVFDEAGKVVQLIPEGREIGELKQTREQLKQNNLELENRVAERTNTLALFSARLKQIHRLAIAKHENIEDLFANYLQSGCQMFGLATGIISNVEQDLYKIVAVKSPLNLAVGCEFPCENTYCSQVIQNCSTIVLNRVGEMESMKNHPVYLDLQLESFIGTPIFVNGRLYGTLNFSDINPRQTEFTEGEKEIIELMARDIGNSIASVYTEKALITSEARFRNTFEQAAVGVAHVSPEGRFIKVNQRLCDIVKYDNNTLVNLTFQEITHAEDLAIDLEYVRQLLQGEIDKYSMEKRYIRSDGSVVWINLTVSLVKDYRGQPEYFIAVIEDISDRKNTETALEESRIKLKQANKAKDNFIAHMSHELRTPLTSILGFAKLLKRDSLLPSQRLHYANVVHQSGEHLLTLINDILDFSKITASQLKLESEDFNLIPFLTQIITTLRIRAQEKQIELSSIFSPALPITVNGDFNRLRQVLYNLIGNAIKFTDSGGVTFKVSCVTDDSDTNRQESTKIAKIRFEIEDTGIGIPQDKLENIFAPFEQLNSNTSKYKGTGLGLTISQNLIKLMNSQIQIESQEDRGSKFWFDLELQPANNILPAVYLPQCDRQEFERLQTPQKILIVDDNEDNRILLVGFLQPLGFVIEEANNGAVALGIAKTFQPDAILTDMVMPVMDGREMIARIKQQPLLKHIPIFMISANSQMIIKPSEVNCDAFLPKPLDLEKLLDLLENYLDLDWKNNKAKTDRDASSTLDAPPKSEIIRLLELVSFGDLQAVEEQASSLAALETKYDSFAKEIAQLAASFEQNQLESFLEHFLNRSDNFT